MKEYKYSVGVKILWIIIILLFVTIPLFFIISGIENSDFKSIKGGFFALCILIFVIYLYPEFRIDNDYLYIKRAFLRAKPIPWKYLIWISSWNILGFGRTYVLAKTRFFFDTFCIESLINQYSELIRELKRRKEIADKQWLEEHKVKSIDSINQLSSQPENRGPEEVAS